MSNKFKSYFQPEWEEEIETKIETEILNEIILYNDDVNTFDHVIECLVSYCDHTTIQAEQCALIVYYKGKCSIKIGTINELKPICETLLDNGLSAVIE